jgi:hypothetical protein
MLRRNIMGLVICLVTLGVASMGFAGVPDLTLSTATTAATGIVSVYTIPNGQGATIGAAKAAASSVLVDATITLNVVDAFGVAIFQYPFEDMWLETAAGGLALCNGGSVADASTDINGDTTFSGALFAGGGSAYVPSVSVEQCIVMIDGYPLVQPGFDILFNSGDLTGDTLVGVQDTALFKPLYINGTNPTTPVYDYSVDFYFDEVITLSDLVQYAGASNTQCP